MEAYAREPSVASLLRSILGDIQTLLRQEFALARQELREDVDRVKGAAGGLAAGIFLLALGGAVVVLMIGAGVAATYGWPNWVGYGAAGVVLFLVGVIWFALAMRRLRRLTLVPEQTVQTLAENVQWLKQRTRSGTT